MPINDALQWTRYDAARALITRLDTYRLLVSMGIDRPYDTDAVAEMMTEYDRLTRADEEEAAREMDFRPTWAYVDVH